MTRATASPRPARLAGIKDTTLRKAIAAGRIAKTGTAHQAVAPAATDPSTKSQRSQRDAALLEVRRLTQSGHQTAIITTARTLASPAIAGRTLTIGIHRMASPAHDRAIALLLADLTATEFRHPDTGHRFIYQLV